jgi:hypothetical protein
VAPSPKKQTVTSSALQLGPKRRARGDAHGAADNGVGAEIAVALVGDMHRAALAPAIAFFLAQQFAEHFLELGALGHAMAVAAVGGGDLVVVGQRLADAHGDGFLAGIHMRQPRHLGREVELVGVVLEGADADHLAVHPQIVLGVGFGFWRGSLNGSSFEKARPQCRAGQSGGQ